MTWLPSTEEYQADLDYTDSVQNGIRQEIGSVRYTTPAQPPLPEGSGSVFWDIFDFGGFSYDLPSFGMGSTWPYWQCDPVGNHAGPDCYIQELAAEAGANYAGAASACNRVSKFVPTGACDPNDRQGIPLHGIFNSSHGSQNTLGRYTKFQTFRRFSFSGAERIPFTDFTWTDPLSMPFLDTFSIQFFVSPGPQSYQINAFVNGWYLPSTEPIEPRIAIVAAASPIVWDIGNQQCIPWSHTFSPGDFVDPQISINSPISVTFDFAV